VRQSPQGLSCDIFDKRSQPEYAAMAPYKSSAKDPLIHLSEAWRVLRLSMAFPARIPTWDAILLTAASPAQADLFQWQLQWAKRTGIISSGTVVLAIPDPEGHRIGSGAATLCALQGLAKHLETSDFHVSAESS
jgi:fucokinase